VLDVVALLAVSWWHCGHSGDVNVFPRCHCGPYCGSYYGHCGDTTVFLCGATVVVAKWYWGAIVGRTVVILVVTLAVLWSLPSQ